MTATTDTQLSLIPAEPLATMADTMHVDSLPPNEELVGPAPDSGFVDSIRQYGILTPIQVAIVAGTTAMIVTDGRRRLKAARLTGMEFVPVTILNGDLNVASLSVLSNARRSHNEASDLQSVNRLVAEGYDLSAIAVATGLPKQTLKKRLKLTKLNDALMALFMAGSIPVSVAERCTYLAAEQQDAMVALYEAKGRLGMRDVMQAQRVRHDEAVAKLPDDMFTGPDMDDEDEEQPADLRTLFPDVAAILDEMQARLDSGKEPTVSMARRLLALVN
jgi:ParB/RepB/Spo0J family partition protein